MQTGVLRADTKHIGDDVVTNMLTAHCIKR